VYRSSSSECKCRYVALAAIIASLTLCLGLELISRRKIEQRKAIIEEKKRELQPMAKIAAEVEAYANTKTHFSVESISSTSSS